MKKSLVLWLSALLCCASLAPARAAESPGILGILEIRGLDNLAAAASDLTTAAGQPMPPEMVTMMLYGVLGAAPGALQANGTVRAFWFENGTDDGGLAILLPVENEGADYLAGLGQAGWKNDSETAEGLEHFTAPDGSSLAWKDIYFLKRGATLVACATADDARAAGAALAALPPILPVEGDAALQIRPAAVVEAFGPQIAEQLDSVLQAQPGAPKESAAMGALYLRGYLALAKQLDSFTLGLGVADGSLNVHTRAVPVAGGTLAKWLATVRRASPAASVVNLPGALLAETAHMGDLGLLAPAYFRYMDELMALMPAESNAVPVADYLEKMKAYWAQMAGDFGLALLPPSKTSPIRAVQYVSLKDSAAARALAAQIVPIESQLMSSAVAAGAAGQPLPFQLELVPGEAREYRGIPVDLVTYRVTLGDSIKALWPEGLPAELAIEMAWLPDGMLAGVGDSALTDALIDRALDGVVAPVSALPSWSAFYPTPETNRMAETHFALFDTVRAYLALADSFTGADLAASIPAGSGNLDGSAYPIVGGLMKRARFSLADIGAIAQKIRESKAKRTAAHDNAETPIRPDESGMEAGADDPAAPAAAEANAEPAEAPADETPAPAAAE